MAFFNAPDGHKYVSKKAWNVALDRKIKAMHKAQKQASRECGETDMQHSDTNLRNIERQGTAYDVRR